MKFFTVLLLALPLLASSSRVGDQDFLVQSERRSPTPADEDSLAQEEYEYDVDEAEIDEETQTDKTSLPLAADVLRNADEEAAKERRRLANLHRKFSLPFYMKDKNETSDDTLADEESNGGESDETVVSDHPGVEAEEDTEEEAVREDDTVQPAYRPRPLGRFGGRHQADESKSEPISNSEEREIQENPLSNIDDGSNRQRTFGRFGGRRQEHHSELIPDNEDGKNEGESINNRRYRPRQLGRFGGRHQADEFELESISNDEGSEGLKESDHSTPLTTAAPTRALTGLLDRYRSSRTESNLATDPEENDYSREASSGGEEYDIDYIDDQETLRRFTRNNPRHSWIRSQY